jgi:hypothetical protein
MINFSNHSDWKINERAVNSNSLTNNFAVLVANGSGPDVASQLYHTVVDKTRITAYRYLLRLWSKSHVTGSC